MIVIIKDGVKQDKLENIQYINVVGTDSKNSRFDSREYQSVIINFDNIKCFAIQKHSK